MARFPTVRPPKVAAIKARGVRRVQAAGPKRAHTATRKAYRAKRIGRTQTA